MLLLKKLATKENRKGVFAAIQGLTTGIIEINSEHEPVLTRKAQTFIHRHEIPSTIRSLTMNGRAKREEDVYQSGLGRHFIQVNDLYAIADVTRKDTGAEKEVTVTFTVLRWQLDQLKQALMAFFPNDLNLPTISEIDSGWRATSLIPRGRIPTYYGERKQFINKDLYSEIDSIVKRMKDDPNWYHERHMAYKETILLSGPPGTGKSSLVRHLASRHGLDVVIASPEDVAKGGLSFNKKNGKPLIVLLEDIDSSPILLKDKDGLNTRQIGSREESYSRFINALDGIVPINNMIVFMTTNFPEMLKDSVIRKGRVDHSFYLDHLETKDVLEALEFKPNTSLARHIKKNYVKGDIVIGMVSEIRGAKTTAEIDAIVKAGKAHNFSDKVDMLNPEEEPSIT